MRDKTKYEKPKRSCPVCSTVISGGKLKRHMKRQHKEIFLQEPGEEHQKMKKFRNDGIVNVNKAKVLTGEKNYQTVHKFEGTVVHCKLCKGAYSQKTFHKHKRSCYMKGQGDAVKFVRASNLSENFDDGFMEILSSFQSDDVGDICRGDEIIKYLGQRLWKKEKYKVGKADEVRKTVMSTMRLLGRLYLSFQKFANNSVSAEDMFKKENWSQLEAAIEDITIDEKGNLKYGVKHALYYHLLNAVQHLEGRALTENKGENVYREYELFQKVLEHHQPTTFSDAMYMINKSRQEKLRLPEQLPPEDCVQVLKQYTVGRISHIMEKNEVNLGKSDFVELRNLVCCRTTLFNARRGGEPCRMFMPQWIERAKWVKSARLTEEEQKYFKKMDITFCNSKGNKLSSCIFPVDVVPAMDLLCKEEFRASAGVLLSNKYIFANTENSNHHVDGWQAIHNVSVKSGLPQHVLGTLTATSQRKRISTIYAGLDIDVNDRPLFYHHMGHSEKVNAGTYQRPLAVRTLAKIGSVLMDIDESGWLSQ